MSIFTDINEKIMEKEESPKIYGVVIGIVTNNQDPDDKGRVKVKFPWLPDDYETYWARLVSFMAGPDRGGLFLPEVDDEVLVAFENGDINTPYIIGSLWNGNDSPPHNNSDGKNNIRQIKSRSGHTVIFDDNDQENKAKITIKTNLGHTLELDDTDNTGNILLKTNKDNKIIIDDNNSKIEIKDSSGNEIVIDSSSNSINLKSSQKIKISSSNGEIILDSNTIKLGSEGASLNLVNDTFIDFFNAHTHTSGKSGSPTTTPIVPGIKRIYCTNNTKGQ